MSFESLFKPIKIGPVEIKNRIAMAPCNQHFSDPGGYVSDQDIAYYGARAKGGTGLIVFGAVESSDRDADAASLVIHRLTKWGHVGGMQEIVEICHEFGSKVFVQVAPGLGRQSRHPYFPVLAPSAIPMEKHPENMPVKLGKLAEGLVHFKIGHEYATPQAATVEDILKIEDDFAFSARLALYAGFDGIEIHVSHGYFGYEFFSTRTNKRTDQYGGSLENRMRFAIELLTKTKAVVQNQCAVGVRTAAQEHMPGGVTLEETKIIVKELEKAGADYISVSDGCMEAMKYLFPENEDDHLLDEVNELRKVLNIPVVTPSIHDPDHAESALKQGKTDMIGLGRQLMADPDWANKVKEGRIGEINRCRRDYMCLALLFAEGRVRCAYNPNLGRERYMPEYWPQKKAARLPSSLLIKKRG